MSYWSSAFDELITCRCADLFAVLKCSSVCQHNAERERHKWWWKSETLQASLCVLNSNCTIWRTLNKYDLFGKSKHDWCSKNKQTKKKNYLNKQQKIWNNVLWTDLIKVELFDLKVLYHVCLQERNLILLSCMVGEVWWFGVVSWPRRQISVQKLVKNAKWPVNLHQNVWKKKQSRFLGGLIRG